MFILINMMSIKLVNDVIKKRFNILIAIIITIFIIIFLNLFNIIIFKGKEYDDKLYEKTSRVYISKQGERGKIYDRNGKLLVGNKKVNIIVYSKRGSVSSSSELKIAKLLSENINFDYNKVSKENLKDYYLLVNKEKLIKRASQNINSQYEDNKITKKEYLEYLYNLITEEDLTNMTEDEKKISYVYGLMNNGYKYAYKTLKSNNVSDEEIKYILDNINSLDGIEISYTYERIYPYGDILKAYLGKIGNILSEDLDDLIKKGYSREDIVGISYLEKEYEPFLHPQNETYIMTATGERRIVTKASAGKDIYLTIDIDLQTSIEKVIYENIVKAKKEKNTKFYNRSYAMISNPSTGEIFASAGIGVINNNKEYQKVDYLTDLSTVSITPGSIVKAASHLVGYENNFISFGYKVTDSCIKIKNTPEKCSWKSLGKIDDLQALKYSSNYYQFLIAIKAGKGKYTYNGPLALDSSGFKLYRDMYNQFGLGVKTGVDLPYEAIGYIGNDKNSGSLLDFPIGQYDTYTSFQILQYINTVATSGERNALHYLKEVKENNNVVYEYNKKTLNNVKVNSDNMNRVKTALKMVMEKGGTGYGYIDLKYNPSGKTGSSQSFLDSDLDGVIDTKTVTSTFGGYIKDGNKEFSIVVVSPHVSIANSDYMSGVNKKISRNISDLYFKNYY